MAGGAHAANVCRLVSGGGLSFGLYDVLSPAPTDSLMTVTVACDRNGGPQHISVTLGISPGGQGGSVSARRMAHLGGGGDLLAYGLFRDVGRSSTWGYSNGVDTVSQSLSVPNRGSASTTFAIYGRIPPQQNVAAGNYADTVQLTVSP